MHTQLRGLFVCLESKQWDSFDDNAGNAVVGGESHKIWFYDHVGNVLHSAKILGGSNGIALDRANLDKCVEVKMKGGFGTEIDVSCSVKARNNVVTLTLLGIAPVKGQ